MAVILPCIPVALFNPYFGVLAYVWVGLMNPHRYVYRLTHFPVALLFATATMAGMVITRKFGRFPVRAETILILVWFVYTTATSLVALNPNAWLSWDSTSKTLLMTIVVAMLLQAKNRLNHLIYVLVGSISFFGFKGGIFSLATKGHYMVFGPPGSFIEGNNELALAELMVMPLILYLIRQYRGGWRRRGLQVLFLLNGISVVFSYSRGDIVALLGVIMLVAWRSRYRVRAIAAGAVAISLLVAFAPKAWTDRMHTIETYRQDPSAMGRINAWQFAWNLASDRPIGGGFRAFTPALFLRYAPDPSNYHDAHSIYFQALGEQGFPGIVIYMTLMIASLLRMQRLRALTRGQPQFKWVRDLAEMLQCSIVGYALGGAFLTVAYFDLYYYLVIAGVLLDVVYWDERHRLSQEVEVVPAMAPVLVPMPAPRPA
jgi:probable O-glycosylation ligase (exosortase A-associated)